MSFSDRQLLDHILEAVEVASILVEEGYERFLAEPKSQYASDTVVARIGESAKVLSEQMISRMPEIPWKLVKGMRDRIAHASIKNDYQIIWSSMVNDIPAIGAAVRKVIETDSGQ
jgi:uncharacterized protein with HEPN domain